MLAFDISIKCSKKLHDNNFTSYSYHLTLLNTFLLMKLVDLKVGNYTTKSKVTLESIVIGRGWV